MPAQDAGVVRGAAWMRANMSDTPARPRQRSAAAAASGSGYSGRGSSPLSGRLIASSPTGT